MGCVLCAWDGDTNVRPKAMMRATQFIWQAAGCPLPVDTTGAPIHPPDLGRTHPHCASCGESASYRLDQAISDSFTTVQNNNRAWPYGGNHVCAACTWCTRTLALRCALWFARVSDEHGTGGFCFVPCRPIPGHPETRPDPLTSLLNPPPAPFVACLPLYGIDHGGEANAHRAVWWNTDGSLYLPADPLTRLQSKHVALFAQVSMSRERYRLQVDDCNDITVDVELWTSLRRHCDRLLLLLRSSGVGANESREALVTLQPPLGFKHCPATWRASTELLKPYHSAAWWKLFVQLLLMPELVKTPRKESR